MSRVTRRHWPGNPDAPGLSATRYRGPASGKEAHEGLNLWIGRFAGACTRAVDDAASFEQRVQQIQDSWRAQLGSVRSGSAADLLLRSLPGAPVLLTVNGAAELIGRSFPQTNEAAFEAKDIINAFTDLERQLASPAGDARSSEPNRRYHPSAR